MTIYRIGLWSHYSVGFIKFLLISFWVLLLSFGSSQTKTTVMTFFWSKLFYKSTRGLRGHLFRDRTRLLPCPTPRSRRDRGEDFYLIPIAAPAIAAPAIAAPAIAGGYGYAAGYGHAIAPIGAGLPTHLDVAGQVYPAAEPYLHDLAGEAYPEAEPYVHDTIGDAADDASPAAEEYVHDASGEAAPAAEPYIHDATGEVYPAAEPYVHIEPIAAIPAIAHPAPIAAPAIGYARKKRGIPPIFHLF